jgi:NTE family protein
MMKSIRVALRGSGFDLGASQAIAVDGGCCDNIPACALTVDDVPRVGIYLESDDAPLLPGAYGIATLAPRKIDLLLASSETSHFELDSKNGAQIIRAHTCFVSKSSLMF